MKKMLLLTPLIVLVLGACIPGIIDQQPAAVPIDLQATVEFMASTKAAQTVESLPTATMEPPTNTPEPEPTATETPTMEPGTETETPDGSDTTGTPPETPIETPNDSVTETGTSDVDVATATTTVTPSPSATPTSIYPSPTSPIAINLPPDSVPRYTVTIVNKSGVRAYISLQGFVTGGYYPIIEYDLDRWEKAKIKAPKGFYTVVVWVGADPMIDYVNINTGVTITIKKDSLKIEK